jgi:hypothetical protein
MANASWPSVSASEPIAMEPSPLAVALTIAKASSPLAFVSAPMAMAPSCRWRLPLCLRQSHPLELPQFLHQRQWRLSPLAVAAHHGQSIIATGFCFCTDSDGTFCRCGCLFA